MRTSNIKNDISKKSNPNTFNISEGLEKVKQDPKQTFRCINQTILQEAIEFEMSLKIPREMNLMHFFIHFFPTDRLGQVCVFVR